MKHKINTTSIVANIANKMLQTLLSLTTTKKEAANVYSPSNQLKWVIYKIEIILRVNIIYMYIYIY